MKKKIFVSIASYRDTLCGSTVTNLFHMAKHPERIHVGICQQNKASDVDCLADLPYKDRVRIIRINYQKAKGPTFARYLCSKLYQHEDFFMQIDSHMLFVRDWDEKAIHMIHTLETHTTSNKVVLSHYPPDYTDYKENPSADEMVTHIVHPYFNEDGILTFKGAVMKEPLPLPRRNAFVAGGFFFCRGHFLKEMPYDPHLPYLFTGEELLLSVRFFTHGWDVYTPNLNLVYHAYVRETEPKFWDETSYQHSNINDVNTKVKIIAGLIKDDLEKIQSSEIRRTLYTYGLGTERTLEEFYTFIGVDPNTKTIGKPVIEFYCDSSSKRSVVIPYIILLLVIFAILLVITLCRLS